MDWVEANGVSLRYELSGNGDHTLILIHEMGGSLESWDEVLPEFQKHFRVLRYDQRGFGLSEKTSIITMDSILADLNGLIDALQISTPCHLAATALGAGMALGFAIHSPERVARLAVASPSTRGSQSTIPAREERIKNIQAGGMRSSCDKSLAKSYPERLRKNTARFERYRNRWLANDPESFIAINRFLSTLDVTEGLATLTCPVLVIGGEYDEIRTPPMSKGVADQIPSANYIEVKTGHFMAVQTPELFIQHVLPFLREEAV